MQGYKIIIPDRNVCRRVQEKAFDLGYRWAYDELNLVQHLDANALSLESHGMGYWYIPHAGNSFRDWRCEEISWQDFLKIGEPVGYKVRINVDPNSLVQSKLFSLGYTWVIGNQNDQPIPLENIASLVGLYIRPDKKISMSMRQSFFDNSPCEEISIEDILASEGELKINQQENNIMSEKTLKLTKAPSKAKNLTVGKDYTGIFTNAEDTQVDDIKDAKYFYCVNDAGNEARYSIGLFDESAPAIPARPQAPPRPVFPTYEQVLERIVFDNRQVRYVFNNTSTILINSGVNILSSTGSNISCGVKGLNGLDTIEDLLGSLDLDELDHIFHDFTGQQEENFKDFLFKGIVKYFLGLIAGIFAILSTREDNEYAYRAMSELVAELGGTETTSEINPNSGNHIKVWVLKKP